MPKTFDSSSPRTNNKKPVLEISVVVPVYNPAGTLPSLHAQLMAVISIIAQSYEIIFVDDGNSDDSWTVIQSLRETYRDHLVAVQLMRNYGQHNTLMCWLGLARGENVVTMDDDLQNPLEEIPNLQAHIKQHGIDLVHCCLRTRKHTAWRNFGANIVWHFYCTIFRNSVTPAPFRIMRDQLAQSLKFCDLNFTYLNGLLDWCTNRIGGVEVEHHPRVQGNSGYSLGKLLSLALNLYTNFFLKPPLILSDLMFRTVAFGFVVSNTEEICS